MSNNNENIYLGKIKEGDVFKNYKELCAALGEKVKNGTSKKAQLKEWDRFFKVKNNGGYSLLIDKLYKEPLEKEDGRSKGGNSLQYIDLLEKLILDLIVNSEDEKLNFSKNTFMKKLKMVNDSYTYGKYYPHRASKELKIKKEELDDFYGNSDLMLNRNLMLAINRLENKSLITFNKKLGIGVARTNINKNVSGNIKGTIIEDEDGYGDVVTNFSLEKATSQKSHRIATDKEINFIRDTERKHLILMGANSKKDVFSQGKQSEFYRKVINELFDERNIFTYYTTYEILFNPNYILDEWMRQEIEITGKTREVIQSELNKSIVERLKSNSEKRVMKATSLHEFARREIDHLRAEETYLTNNNRLIENFIVLKDEDD